MATLMTARTQGLRTATSSFRTFSNTSAAKAAFSTTRTAPLQQLHKTQRPSIVCRIPPTHALAPSLITSRHASTDAPSTPTPQQPPSDVLTWNRFFDLRRKRRYLNLVASVASAATAVSVGGPLLASQDIDSYGAQITGLDPMIVMGLSVFGVAGIGWLCGPSFGSALFGVWAARRGWGRAILEKEKSFFKRIQKHRADPASSSPQNPIPDYYGEKIGSVKDYRRWLKDQRAFKLKKNKNLF